MIVLTGIDAEANHDGIEKSRLGKRDAAASKVLAHVELELVCPRDEGRAVEERLPRAAILVGDRTGHELARICRHVETNSDASGRPAAHRIEDVCRQTSHSAPSAPVVRANYTLLSRLRAGPVVC